MRKAKLKAFFLPLGGNELEEYIIYREKKKKM